MHSQHKVAAAWPQERLLFREHQTGLVIWPFASLCFAPLTVHKDGWHERSLKLKSKHLRRLLEVGGIRVINPIHCGRQTGQTGKLKVFVYIVTSQHCTREAGEEESQPIKCNIILLFYRVIVQLFKVKSSVLGQYTRILLSQNEQFPSCSCIKIWDNQCVGLRATDSPLPELYFIPISSWDMVNRVLYPLDENNKIMDAHIVLARRWKCLLMFSCSVVFRQINLMMKCAFI